MPPKSLSSARASRFLVSLTELIMQFGHCEEFLSWLSSVSPSPERMEELRDLTSWFCQLSSTIMNRLNANMIVSDSDESWDYYRLSWPFEKGLRAMFNRKLYISSYRWHTSGKSLGALRHFLNDFVLLSFIFPLPPKCLKKSAKRGCIEHYSSGDYCEREVQV